MNKRYIVRLTKEEHSELERLVSQGKTQSYRIKHGNILLAVDAEGPNWTDEQTAVAFSCHQNTVRNVRQRFVEKGLEAALERKKQETPSRSCILDGEKEARLIAISRSQPPEGTSRWTLQMLADRLVELKAAASISAPTVHRTLKKTNSSLTCESIG